MGMIFKKNKLIVIGMTITLIFSSGCMPSKFEKRLAETEELNKSIEKGRPEKPVTEDTLPEDVKLSEEQRRVIENAEQVSPEDAVAENKLDQRFEQNMDMPIENTNISYDDVEEFSQFLGKYFYLYHSNQITADVFYNNISPHFHMKFKELLPESKKIQIRTFEILQEQFLIHLPSKITGYKLTNVETDPRTKESSFYREYTLENGQKVYYVTIIQPIEDQWLLINDKPAPPYEITPKIQKEIEGTEEEQQE